MEDNNNRSTDDSPSRDTIRGESSGIRSEDSGDQYDDNYGTHYYGDNCPGGHYERPNDTDNEGHYHYYGDGCTNYDHNDCPHTDFDSNNRTCLNDTAPFNVAAFLQYLHNRDNNFGNDPAVNCHSDSPYGRYRTFGCSHYDE